MQVSPLHSEFRDLGFLHDMATASESQYSAIERGKKLSLERVGSVRFKNAFAPTHIGWNSITWSCLTAESVGKYSLSIQKRAGLVDNWFLPPLLIFYYHATLPLRNYSITPPRPQSKLPLAAADLDLTPCVCEHPQSCPILWGLMCYSLLGSSVHGISQARILEGVAISSFISSRESSWPRNRACVSYVSCIGRQILYHWVTWEAPQFDSSLILNPTLAPLNTCTCFSQTSNLHT